MFALPTTTHLLPLASHPGANPHPDTKGAEVMKLVFSGQPLIIYS